jgi:hypothetical protein
MTKLLKGFIALTVFASLSTGALAVDLAKVEADLKGEGAVGWMHGATEHLGLYAFTIRNPENFFDYVIVSLVDSESVSRAKLAEFSRHDKVRIQGEFLDNSSPQKHVLVKAIELVKKYEPAAGAMPDYQYQTDLPKDLLGLNSAKLLVHAIGGEGHILVTEFKDAIVPIFVRNAALTKDLFRNDIIEARFRVQSHPSRPAHLRLLENEPQPIKVIERIQQKHLQAADMTGSLVMFQKSPDIIFNVFAVQELLSDGLSRQYTIVNFKDPEIFAKIRQKLQDAWTEKPDSINGRNKLVSQKLKVRVRGVFNIVDANQANAQILVESPDQISVEAH